MKVNEFSSQLGIQKLCLTCKSLTGEEENFTSVPVPEDMKLCESANKVSPCAERYHNYCHIGSQFRHVENN